MYKKMLLGIIAFSMILVILVGYTGSYNTENKKITACENELEVALSLSVDYKGNHDGEGIYVYNSKYYEFDVDQISGKLNRIRILPEIEESDKNNLIYGGPDIDSIKDKAVDLFTLFVTEPVDKNTLEIIEKGNEDIGYTLNISQMDGLYPTGNEAQMGFDYQGILISASFFRDESSDYADIALSYEDALSAAIQECEAWTMSGSLEGAQNVESFTFRNSSYHFQRINEITYYDFEIFADVVFSDRGSIEKTYSVRVNAVNGQATMLGWTLN